MESLVALLRNFGQLFQWWAVIAPWERGLRVRLGKHVKELRAGVHLRIPFVDQVHKQSVRLRVAHLPTQTLASKDRKLVTIGATLGYSIDNVSRLYQRLHHAEDTIRNIAQRALADVVETTLSDSLQPGYLGFRATELIEDELGDYGLEEVEIRITDFAFIRAYRLIIDARNGSQGRALATEPSELKPL